LVNFEVQYTSINNNTNGKFVPSPVVLWRNENDALINEDFIVMGMGT